MNTAERVRLIRQVEEVAGTLTKQGFRVERVEHVDEEGEPFRSVIQVAHDGERDERRGIL